MCGIIGYIGNGTSLNLLIDGLKRLEYRGYDSAGVAYVNGNGLDLYKAKGKLQDLLKELPDPFAPHTLRSGPYPLGHPRRAVLDECPSPRGAGRRRRAQRHHRELLRAEARARGRRPLVRFRDGYGGRAAPDRAAARTGPLLSGGTGTGRGEDCAGSFALGVLCEANPDTLFAVRRGSPLVLGIGEGEYYLCLRYPGAASLHAERGLPVRRPDLRAYPGEASRSWIRHRTR